MEAPRHRAYAEAFSSQPMSSPRPRQRDMDILTKRTPSAACTGISASNESRILTTNQGYSQPTSLTSGYMTHSSSGSAGSDDTTSSVVHTTPRDDGPAYSSNSFIWSPVTNLCRDSSGSMSTLYRESIRNVASSLFFASPGGSSANDSGVDQRAHPSGSLLGYQTCHSSSGSNISHTSDYHSAPSDPTSPVDGYHGSRILHHLRHRSISEESSDVSTDLDMERLRLADVNGADNDVSSADNDVTSSDSSSHGSSRVGSVPCGVSSGGSAGRRGFTRSDRRYLSTCPTLPKLERAPWSQVEVLRVLREGRARHLCDVISVQMMHCLARYLERPLARVVREAKRLATAYGKLSRHEVQTALRLVLPPALYARCHAAGARATLLYYSAGGAPHPLRTSRSARCGLHLSVGKFQRWLLDVRAASYVCEGATIYLAAAMENLLEEIVLIALGDRQTDTVLDVDSLHQGIAASCDLWGMLQNYDHLLAGRNGKGKLMSPSHSPDGSTSRQNPNILLTTCVKSSAQLEERLEQVVQTEAPPGECRWSREAVQCLYFYLSCSRAHIRTDEQTHSLHLGKHRRCHLRPALGEWVRITDALTSHHGRHQVAPSDVQDAARVLLPGVDCPPTHAPTPSSHHDNSQMPSLLMQCALRGKETMLQASILSGADPNQQVGPRPAPGLLGLNHWTALTFAAAGGHISVIQALLEGRAAVEGAYTPGEESHADTPLQVATATGGEEAAAVLLGAGADPLLQTTPRAGFTPTYNRTGLSALTLAAAHGHRRLVTRLLAHCRQATTDLLSLDEILVEGNAPPTLPRGRSTRPPAALATKHISQKPAPSCEPHEDADSTYMQIDEAKMDTRCYGRCCHGNKQGAVPCRGRTVICRAAPSPPASSLTKTQQKELQVAMYHAAENGFLDIALDIQKQGVTWTLYIWSLCLLAAYNLHQSVVVQRLLAEFQQCGSDQLDQEFIYDTLPLLFDMFRNSEGEPYRQQLASVISCLYGDQSVPPVGKTERVGAAGIGSRYVNNPDMADVQFIIEGHVFHAHRIILVDASPRFRHLLSSLHPEGATQQVELRDVKYSTFKNMMHCLYSESKSADLHFTDKEYLELMVACARFGLSALQSHCERRLSGGVSLDNCCMLYKHAQVYGAPSLLAHIEGFMLCHLGALIAGSGQFTRLLRHNDKYSVLDGLLSTLTRHLDHHLTASREPQQQGAESTKL